MEWIYYLIFPVITGIFLYCWGRREKLFVETKTGLVPDIAGWNTEPKHKMIIAEITNKGPVDCYIKSFNFRYKKGSSTELVGNIDSFFTNKKLIPGETIRAKFPVEKLSNKLKGSNFSVLRCELITSRGKRVVSKYVVYEFKKEL